MRRYLGRQTLQLVAVILGISLLSFSILHVIGDPVVLMVPETAPREEHERILAIAIEHFAVGGYHGTSTNVIARENIVAALELQEMAVSHPRPSRELTR